MKVLRARYDRKPMLTDKRAGAAASASGKHQRPTGGIRHGQKNKQPADQPWRWDNRGPSSQKEIMFFSEEKNQKTFTSPLRPTSPAMAGIYPRAPE